MYAKLQRGPCFIMIPWSHDAACVGGSQIGSSSNCLCELKSQKHPYIEIVVTFRGGWIVLLHANLPRLAYMFCDASFLGHSLHLAT